MLLNQKTKKKLQNFLSAMPEETLAVLVRGIEKSRLSGGEDPLTNMILLTVRQNAQQNESKLPRVSGSLRLFSMPFESFLVEQVTGPKQAARIERSSVLKVWQWLGRDLIPETLGQISDQVNSAVLENNHEAARKFVTQLRVVAVEAIHKVRESFDDNPKEKSRIAGQLGGAQVLSDAFDIADILACADDLLVLQNRLSSRVNGLEGGEVVWCLNKVESFIERYSNMLPHALTLVMRQLERPAEIVRLAKAMIGSEEAIKISAHPYSVTVDLVLYDVQCKIEEICLHIDSEGDIDQLSALISSYHDLMHYLQLEIEFGLKSDWSHTITRLRSQLSERLSAKLIEAPRLIKAALNPGGSNSRKSVVGEIKEAEYVLKLMKVCLHVVDELALNELLSRIRRESEQFMTAMGDAAVESLRHSDEASRAVAQARADAAVRLTKIVFGGEISELLRNAADIARRTAEADSDMKLANSA